MKSDPLNFELAERFCERERERERERECPLLLCFRQGRQTEAQRRLWSGNDFLPSLEISFSSYRYGGEWNVSRAVGDTFGLTSVTPGLGELFVSVRTFDTE